MFGHIPRRVGWLFCVKGVFERQVDSHSTVLGPSAKIAFKDGKPQRQPRHSREKRPGGR